METKIHKFVPKDKEDITKIFITTEDKGTVKIMEIGITPSGNYVFGRHQVHSYKTTKEVVEDYKNRLEETHKFDSTKKL